ncbi:MAG: hypothetical protein EGR30_04800 [Prevotella copri]|nr:hypothetical protein [Segatella copri]
MKLISIVEAQPNLRRKSSKEKMRKVSQSIIKSLKKIRLKVIFRKMSNKIIHMIFLNGMKRALPNK